MQDLALQAAQRGQVVPDRHDRLGDPARVTYRHDVESRRRRVTRAAWQAQLAAHGQASPPNLAHDIGQISRNGLLHRAGDLGVLMVDDARNLQRGFGVKPLRSLVLAFGCKVLKQGRLINLSSRSPGLPAVS